jgi:hypothetical protein
VIACDSPSVCERRQAALADRALACADALGQDIHGIVESGARAHRHTPGLRRLARRSDVLGLSDLAEAARLAVVALSAPRREGVLVGQAIDVLTLAGQAVKRGVPVRADLYPVVEALRDHLRYAEAKRRQLSADARGHD